MDCTVEIFLATKSSVGLILRVLTKLFINICKEVVADKD